MCFDARNCQDIKNTKNLLIQLKLNSQINLQLISLDRK